MNNERKYKAGYIVRTELVNGREMECEDFTMKSAYTHKGLYIGNSKTAHFLCKKKGIAPELKNPEAKVCSIGFCKNEQKWYGWSHRAIHGFEVGSTVKKGDLAYAPTDEKDFLNDCVRFWSCEYHSEVWAVEDCDVNGGLGVTTSWRHNDKAPNKDIHGKVSSSFLPYPDEFGNGEWTALSLDDAKQMAIDFANGVD